MNRNYNTTIGLDIAKNVFHYAELNRNGRVTDRKYSDVNVFAPHHTGIPAHVVANSVAEFELGIEIPFETFN